MSPPQSAVVPVQPAPSSLFRRDHKPSRTEAEAAVRTLLRWIGEDPARDGLVDTPSRVVRSFDDFFGGYSHDPVEILQRTFEETQGYDEMVSCADRSCLLVEE